MSGSIYKRNIGLITLSLIFSRELDAKHPTIDTVTQGRIQEFILGGPNQGPQSKVKGEARIEGAKRPSIEGEARVEGEARELRAKPEPRAKPEKKRGEGSGEGAR